MISRGWSDGIRDHVDLMIFKGARFLGRVVGRRHGLHFLKSPVQICGLASTTGSQVIMLCCRD